MNPQTDIHKPKIEKWLLVSYCQAIGLANSLNILCRDISVQYYAISKPDELSQILSQSYLYDRILIYPYFDPQFTVDLDKHKNVIKIPLIYFYGYHPDFCFMHNENGQPLSNMIGGLQSIIAYACYSNGLSEDKTLSMYCEHIYHGLGYFDFWDVCREKLLHDLNIWGYDLRESFIGWSRRGPFMHSFHHPKIFVLYDFAKKILESVGLNTIDADMLPHDNLTNGPILPVYPEIASRLGIKGSYVFKTADRVNNTYRCMHLDEFVRDSFSSFRNCNKIKFLSEHEERISQAISFIERIK